MGYLIHEILHFLIGLNLAYILAVKVSSPGKWVLTLILGGIAAISPDITKFFGDDLGHSIWLVPVIGLMLALNFHVLQKDLSFLKAWGFFSMMVLIGHIFIDYLGNGVAFLFPILQEEFSFSIIRRNDYLIILTLLMTILIGVFYQKGKMIILTGLIIIFFYLGGLTVSKLQLEQALKEKYKDDGINLLLTYRSNNFLEWSFMVRTDKVWVNGYSPILSNDFHIEDQREVDE